MQLTKNLTKILLVFILREMYKRNFHWENHGTIIRTEIICKMIPL